MREIMLILNAVLCTALYISVYFSAEAPRAGSLEWIGMYEKPKMSRQGVLHRLKWLDILWCFLMGLLALGLYIGLGTFIDPSMVRASLMSGWLFLSAAPSVLMAAAAYLLGKLLSGRFLGGLLPVLFLGFSSLLNLYFMEVLLMLGCLLLLLAFFVGKGFWAWLSLVLSGVLLAFATWEQPTYSFFILPWLGTVLLAEILRIKQEDVSPWHLILTLLVAVLSVGVTITLVHSHRLYQSLSVSLMTPGVYAIFWLQLFITVIARFFAAPDISPVLLLPSASLLVAGVVMAIGAVKKRHTFGVILLLWTGFGLLLAVCFPSAPPIFLAVWVLAWLVSRIDTRGYRGAAVVTGLIPTAITALMTILTLWRYV